jgi:hypothetical protein
LPWAWVGCLSTLGCGPIGSLPEGVSADVLLTVLTDGSVEVTEDVTIRAGSSPVTAFSIDLPSRGHDGLFDFDGRVDGRRAGAEGVARVEFDRPDPRRVTFRFAVTDRDLTLSLRYRAAGVVARSGSRGRLEWPAWLPVDYRSGPIRMTVRFPAGAALFDPPGIAQAGWEVAPIDGGFSATRAALEPGEGATVMVEFVASTLSFGRPAWQFREDLARELRPAFVSAGLFFVVVAAGIVVMSRLARASAGSADRERIRRGLLSGGWSAVVFGALSGLVTWLFLSGFGPAVHAVPAGLIGGGILIVVLRGRPQ